jgi:PAS domain S-box-containing protein
MRSERMCGQRSTAFLMKEKVKSPAGGWPEQVAALVRTLDETQQRLLELARNHPEAQAAAARLGLLPEPVREKLRQSEERFNQLANNITDVFWIRSADLKQLYYVSPAFEKVWGRPAEALYSHPEKWVDFIHPEDRQRVQQAFDGLAGGAAALDIEYRILWPNGEIRWIRARGFKVRDERGLVIRLAGIITDITERKHAESALRESEERFSGAFHHAPIGVALVAPDGHWLKVNRALCQLLGYSEAELLARTFQELTHPDDLAASLEFVRQALAGGIPGYQMEKRYIHKDGQFITILLSVSLVRDDAGQPLYFISQIQDITERKQAELMLSRTNRALQMLTSINERLIRTADERSLLAETCRVAVNIGGYCMAWVGYAREDEAHTIEPMAFAGAENGYLSNIKLSWSEATPGGRGPAGQAIRSGLPVVCDDITAAGHAFAWQEEARQRDYRGVICLPLRDGEAKRTFGLLALYSATVNRVDQIEIKLLQDLADDLAFGICHLRSQNENKRIQSAVLQVAAGVSASTGTEFFQQLVRSMAGALEARAGFVSQLQPGEPAMARTIAAVVGGETMKNFSYEITGTPCEGLLTADECVIPEKASERFPRAANLAALGGQAYVGRRLLNSKGEVLGQLFVLFDKPLRQIGFVTSTLQIFAARAAAELERQQADWQVREQAALLDAASDGIILKDMHDRILYWNRGARQIYGWTAEEVIGKTSGELLAAEPEAYAAAKRELLQNGFWRGEMLRRAKDGALITVEAHWTLVHDQEGQPKSILAINTDITERKKLETQFLRVQRMESIGTLAGGIAHDLNNVLAPILMSVHMLQETSTSEEDQKLLTALKASALRGAELIKQVLAFARGTEGRRVPIQLVHIIQDIQIIVRDTFPKSIEFAFQRPRELWPVTGNPTQLHQVFMNLCVNSRDAMPAGGRLEISLENVQMDEIYAGLSGEVKSGPYVRVTVSDTGVGISKEIQAQIFDPFFTTKEIGKGTGLGLSTVQSIVKSHGGFIDVTSRPDKGTQFKVYLPAHPEAPAAEADPAKPAALHRGANRLVLVVDDEDSIRAVTEKILKKFGYRVLLAANGAEAVSLFAQHRGEIALVFTDMAMPVMDGPSAIAALRAIDPHVKIIGCSGHASTGRVANIAECGLKYFIHKPYSAETMLKIFDEALAEPAPT